MNYPIIIIFLIVCGLALAWLALWLLKQNRNQDQVLDEYKRAEARADFFATLYSEVLQVLEDEGVEVNSVIEEVKEDMLRHIQEEHNEKENF